jgi:hypothetical protein
MRTQHDNRVIDVRVIEGQSQHSGPAHGTAGAGDHGSNARHGGHGGHGWMMIACCIPMLAIAVILVATGAASPTLLFGAIGCTLMMAMMMRGMSHGGGDGRR